MSGAGWVPPCRYDPEGWFPEHNKGQAEAAKRECMGCYVINACLSQALAFEGDKQKQNRFGIWGGKTPGERAAIWRRQRAAQIAREAAA